MEQPTLSKFDPVGEYLLLIPKQAAEVSEGGIFIPEMARGGLTQGTVIKVGHLVKDYGVGDEIIFGQHTESRLDIDNEPYILLNQVNVMMVAKHNEITVFPPIPTPTE